MNKLTLIAKVNILRNFVHIFLEKFVQFLQSNKSAHTIRLNIQKMYNLAFR